MDGTVAGMVANPCTTNCKVPLFPHCAFERCAPRSKRVNASQVPWLATRRLAHEAPEPAREPMPIGARGGARVAVCVAGMLRTFTRPMVWRSLHEYVLDRGRIDLFAVLGMAGGDATQSNRQGMEGPQAVEAMLTALRPRRTRFVNWEPPPPPCDVGGLGKHRQFSKWAMCADLVPLDGRYDFLLRTRPDVVWRAPLHLASLAARVPAEDIVLTKYDWHMLWPRAQWGALWAMRSVACDPRCGDGGLLFSAFNEYCMMKAHLAKHGIRHLSTVEATAADRAGLFHYTSEAAWTLVFRNDSDRLARWRVSPAWRQRGRGIHCRQIESGRRMQITCADCALQRGLTGGTASAAAASDEL